MFHPATKERRSILFIVLTLLSLSIATAAGAVPNLGRGSVFVMSNEPDGNEILVFRRFNDGRLAPAGSFPTAGDGDGTVPDSLRSQGSLVMSGSKLFAANAGSNNITVFHVGKKQLTRLSTTFSGGVGPRSLAVRGNRLYVVNGGTGNVVGFTVAGNGALTIVPGSTKNLTGGTLSDPAQVSFTRNGRALLITEKNQDVIDVFDIGEDGSLEGPTPVPSSGPGPFGFDFDRRGHLIVSEAAGGAPDAGAVSSYAVAADGSLDVISASVPAGQTASCWIAITRSGFVYTTNTGSSSVSSFKVAKSGTLTLLESVAATTPPGSAPIDLALDVTGTFLYVLSNVSGTISIFEVEEDGGLDLVGTVTGLPLFAQGIVAK